MSTPTVPPGLRSLPDAASHLGGISLRQLYNLIHAGELRRVKIGSRAFIATAELDRYIASLTDAAR